MIIKKFSALLKFIKMEKHILFVKLSCKTDDLERVLPMTEKCLGHCYQSRFFRFYLTSRKNGQIPNLPPDIKFRFSNRKGNLKIQNFFDYKNFQTFDSQITNSSFVSEKISGQGSIKKKRLPDIMARKFFSII